MKILRKLFFVFVLVGLVFLAYAWANSYDHKVFKTPVIGEITTISDGSIIFVPKGAYVIGETHLYASDEDLIFDDILPQNQPFKNETLVKTYGVVVVYWSLDQKETAKGILDN